MIHPIDFKAKLSKAAGHLLEKHPKLDKKIPLADWCDAANVAELPAAFNSPNDPTCVAIHMAVLEIEDVRAGRRPSIELLKRNEEIYGAAHRVCCEQMAA